MERRWELPRLPCGNDRLGGSSADILDPQEAEADRLSLWLEVEIREVNIWRKHRNAKAATLCDRCGNLLLFAAEGVQHARHVLNGVVRLEIRGLIGDQPVAGGVRLIEPVVCERLECLKHLVDRSAGNATFGGARDELLLQAGEDVLFLLPHGVAQGVRLRPREAAEC